MSTPSADSTSCPASALRSGSVAATATGTRRLTQLSLLLAAALLIWLLEATILPSLPVPGAKFGFANVVTLVVIAGYGLSESLANVGLRVVVGSLVVGTLLSPAFILAVVAGTAAAVAMYATYRSGRAGLSLVGVSVVGSVVHVSVQLLLAAILVGTWGVWLQAPILLLVAVGTGCFNGFVAWHLVERLGLGKS